MGFIVIFPYMYIMCFDQITSHYSFLFPTPVNFFFYYFNGTHYFIFIYAYKYKVLQLYTPHHPLLPFSSCLSPLPPHNSHPFTFMSLFFWFRFCIWEKIHDICLSELGLFCWTWWSLVSSLSFTIKNFCWRFCLGFHWLFRPIGGEFSIPPTFLHLILTQQCFTVFSVQVLHSHPLLFFLPGIELRDFYMLMLYQ
jgi:hypothetical protein